MNDHLYDRRLFGYLSTFILAQVVFAAFPGIDLTVSGLFADGRAGFAWADGAPATINLVLRRMGELAVLGLALGCLHGAVTGILHRVDFRAWGFALLTVLIGNGSIVNAMLKAHVGRARPATVTECGGSAHVYPAWQVTDQCARNRSVASGEVSLAASLAIATVVLLWPRLVATRARATALVVAGAYVRTVEILRIGLGRHFLRDAVFSVLLSGAVALILYRFLRVGGARVAFGPRLPILILSRRFQEGRFLAQAWLKRPA